MTDRAKREQHDCDVLIIGAGPVGMVLGMVLARYGLKVILTEIRGQNEPPSVKCNHVSARSMEVFRQLGIVEMVRNAGLPPDYPNDVSYRTTTTGMEIARIPIPCRRDRYSATGGPDTWWPTPEPPHRINQIYLEPVLGRAARAMPGLTILYRHEAVDFDQDADGASARLRDLDNGAERSMRARFLVGCDGGRSNVRRAIGARLEGDAVVQRVQSSFIKAPDLIGRLQAPPAWAMFSLNPRRSGNIYAIDGRELWLVHNYLRPEEPDFESVDRDASIRAILGVGADFQYEVLANEDWFGRRLVANRFRDRRIFICGDAAHLWVPYAGYGMNAGIADAANLGWLIAAHLAGWAPYSILDAHEAERQPITAQVSHFAMNHAEAMARQRGGVPAEIEADTPEGARARTELGRAAYDLNVQQYCCAGLNFGYFYDKSPIIVYDGAEHPGYSMGSFRPSTVPGCRLPHIDLGGGRSLYDLLGPGFTLIRRDAGVPITGLEDAAAARGVPLSVVDLAPDQTDPAYCTKLMIVRPDQHIVWRGDELPLDSAALVDLLRGARRARDPIG
jgi:2-polyprenyl-6-methoxyphenol hydroxylase-like FAD-dependent oxidoreductase